MVVEQQVARLSLFGDLAGAISPWLSRCHPSSVFRVFISQCSPTEVLRISATKSEKKLSSLRARERKVFNNRFEHSTAHTEREGELVLLCGAALVDASGLWHV